MQCKVVIGGWCWIWGRAVCLSWWKMWDGMWIAILPRYMAWPGVKCYVCQGVSVSSGISFKASMIVVSISLANSVVTIRMVLLWMLVNM